MSKSEDWKKHITAQRESGLSRSKYCTLHGLSESNFSYWTSRLSSKKRRASGTFVPVTTSAAPIEIVIGKVVLRVASGSDLSELRRVVEALS